MNWGRSRTEKSNLVDDDDGNVVLGRHADDLAQVPRELLLALRELPAPRELVAEVSHDRVDDHESEGPGLREERCGLGDGLHLLLMCHRSANDYVLEAPVRVEAEALGDCVDALGPEVALGVHIQNLALTPAEVVPELRSHAQRVAELRLPRAELTEELGDGLRLDAAAHDLVEVRRARGDLADGLAHFLHLQARLERAGTQVVPGSVLPGEAEHLLYLGLRQAVDLAQRALSPAHETLDGVHSRL